MPDAQDDSKKDETPKENAEMTLEAVSKKEAKSFSETAKKLLPTAAIALQVSLGQVLTAAFGNEGCSGDAELVFRAVVLGIVVAIGLFFMNWKYWTGHLLIHGIINVLVIGAWTVALEPKPLSCWIQEGKKLDEEDTRLLLIAQTIAIVTIHAIATAVETWLTSRSTYDDELARRARVNAFLEKGGSVKRLTIPFKQLTETTVSQTQPPPPPPPPSQQQQQQQQQQLMQPRLEMDVTVTDLDEAAEEAEKKAEEERKKKDLEKKEPETEEAKAAAKKAAEEKLKKEAEEKLKKEAAAKKKEEEEKLQKEAAAKQKEDEERLKKRKALAKAALDDYNKCWRYLYLDFTRDLTDYVDVINDVPVFADYEALPSEKPEYIEYRVYMPLSNEKPQIVRREPAKSGETRPANLSVADRKEPVDLKKAEEEKKLADAAKAAAEKNDKKND